MLGIIIIIAVVVIIAAIVVFMMMKKKKKGGPVANVTPSMPAQKPQENQFQAPASSNAGSGIESQM